MWLLTYKLYKYQKIFQKTLEKPEFRGNPIHSGVIAKGIITT